MYSLNCVSVAEFKPLKAVKSESEIITESSAGFDPLLRGKVCWPNVFDHPDERSGSQTCLPPHFTPQTWKSNWTKDVFVFKRKEKYFRVFSRQSYMQTKSDDI